MYNENSFKNYIFWIKVKRIFFMIVFSIVGCIIGIIASDYVVNILNFDSMFRTLIVGISTLLFFSISLLITSNTGKEVQDGYWKIAVLRKLTVISKKLDNLDVKPALPQAFNRMIKETDLDDDEIINDIESDLKIPKKAPVPKKVAPVTKPKSTPIVDIPTDPTKAKKRPIKKNENSAEF